MTAIMGYPLKYNCGSGITGICGISEKCKPICKYEDMYYIEIDDVPFDICHSVVSTLKYMPHLKNITINDIVDATEDNCSTDNESQNNYITLFFETGKPAETRPNDYCIGNGGCQNGDSCYDNKCGCLKEEECQEGYRCDNELKKCIECASNKECFDFYEKKKPICVQGICIPCPKSEYWDSNAGKCVNGCRENYNCDDGEYCYIETTWQLSEAESAENGKFGITKSECRNAKNAMKTRNDQIYWASNTSMPVWSAYRLCQALNMEIMSVSDYTCQNKEKGHFCQQTSSNTATYNPNDISEIVQRIKTNYQISSEYCAWGNHNLDYTPQNYTYNVCIYHSDGVGKIDWSYNNASMPVVCKEPGN